MFAHFAISMIPRQLEPIIQARLGRGKAIIVLGPRQVGKTTLVRKLANNLHQDFLYLSCTSC